MNSQTSTFTLSARTIFLALALLLASLFASGAASASTLIPRVDLGVPGGGGGSAMVVDEAATSIFPGVRQF